MSLGEKMKKLLDIQQKIIPEAISFLEKRYVILNEVYLSGVIGRRALSVKTNLSERSIRSEVDFLKDNGFLKISAAGMEITEQGTSILEDLKEVINVITGSNALSNNLKSKLGIKNVIIVPGAIDENPVLLKELAKESTKYFIQNVKKNFVVGVTGGYTMSEFAAQMPKKIFSDLMIVPARGGLGEILEIQANTIASKLASKLDANYKLLQLYDGIGKDIIEFVRNDPQIKSVYDYIKNIDFLVFGIGNAKEMAKRRNIPKEIWDKIEQSGAVSEAFGYYFDINGEILYETSTVGIKLEQYKNLKNIIGIAGGKTKADAILAISKINKNLVLVTDEETGRDILFKLNKKI